MNTGKNRLFIELIQLALGTREHLSRVPSACEWEALYEEAGKQVVVGLLLNGLDRLPVESLPLLELKLQWIGETQMIEFQNKVMDERCIEVLKMLEKAGLKGTILKGQGIARFYEENLKARRQPGDIDVYVDCGLEKAMAFTKALGQNDVRWSYKHLHLQLWEDTEVEVHYRVEFLYNILKNRRLQQWFKEHEELLFNGRQQMGDGKGELVTPSVEMNVFYILLHIYRHFLHEGVGLRQIVDYYFVLRQNCLLRQNNIRTDYKATEDNEEYCKAVKEFGMERFAKGLMWVMKEVLGIPQEWMPWDPDEREGQYILAQVMEGGNFGHYSSKKIRLTGGLGYVMNTVRNSLHLMWRYPSEALWAPVWLVWHKGWKVAKQIQLA